MPFAITPAAEVTKTVLMPLGPASGEDLRAVVEHVTARKSQAGREPVPSVGDECGRDSLAVVQADLKPSPNGMAQEVLATAFRMRCSQVLTRRMVGTVTADCDPDITGALDCSAGAD
jgi:hypothetical protein